MLIRALEPADADACDAIMRGLPEWFGLEHGLVECRAGAVREDGGLAAVEGGARRRVRDAAPVDGCGARDHLARRAPRAARHGLGTALVEAAVARARAEGATFVTAWTVAASDPDPHYASTRAFYARMGFAAAAEAEIWGPENPAVLLVRSVTHQGAPLT